MIRCLLLVILVIIICTTLYYFYSEQNLPVAILMADNEPTKIKPKADLNATISYSDNLIYDALTGKNKRNYGVKNNNISETPLSLIVEEELDDIFNNIFSSSNEIEVSVTEEELDDKLQIVNLKNTSEFIHNFNILKTKNDRLHYIELACAKDEEEAGRTWNILKQKYSKILSSTQMYAKQVKKSGDRIYYIILAGPYQSVSKADAICKKLISNGADCLIHPN